MTAQGLEAALTRPKGLSAVLRSFSFSLSLCVLTPLLFSLFASVESQAKDGSYKVWDLEIQKGTQFNCFTSKKLQILTPET
jgi:hypothetical protein